VRSRHIDFQIDFLITQRNLLNNKYYAVLYLRNLCLLEKMYCPIAMLPTKQAPRLLAINTALNPARRMQKNDKTQTHT